ncbi:uncharacterized protein LOC124299600 [Neodiprion virginianus]|uniref:uncharacterized protein LOC124299600 n=1 Tax=Neodiprion virginianus TaxID=2961670 RepID=UPI001EE6C4CE|nr:uncharacterized protein LOC124299600 [Neodiprion virginianus]
MNLQCKLNSVRATRARFQQPQRLLNTSENAAAGDAPHGQMSSNLPFDSSKEILALDTSLMEIVSKDDTEAKSRSGDPSTCAISNQSWSDAARKVCSASEKDSLYTKTILSEVFDSINAKEARSVSEEFTAGLPYKECSPDIHYGTNYVADNQKYCKSLHDSKLMNMMMLGEKSNEASEIRGRNSNGYSDVEKTPSPNSKISMFSAEIWTEKELPIEACIHPEPKMIDKTYLNNNRTTDEFNCFTRCNTESRDIPLTQMDLDQEVFGQSTLISPPLSARKSRTSSPCRKTINFDGEIWPVCSNLIPSGKELSFFTLGDKSVAASSKILNESDEKTPTSHVFSGCAGTQGASSRSITEQLVLEDSSKNKKQMEPTHEIEYQNLNMNLVETPQRYHLDTRNCCNLNSVTSTLGRTLNNNFPEASLKSQSSVEERLKQESEEAEQSKQEMRKCVLNNSEACEIRNSQKNALTTSKNEPGNIVFGDVSKEEIINSLFCDKISSGVKCREKISSHKTNQKSNSQNLGFTMTYSACATSDQISFGPTNTYKLFEQPENYKSPIISSPVSKLPATELRNFSGSDNFCVEDQEIVKIAKSLPEAVNDESRDKVELVFRNSSLVPDSLSVRSFNEEVNRSTGHISQQIKTDPALNNAVDTLTKIKMIVEANHHMIERLQYRHQNVLIPCLTPLDAGKSLAKALTRCRNYIRKNGESSEAINTVNKLLKIPVQNLKNSVGRQKLALANLGEKHF